MWLNFRIKVRSNSIIYYVITPRLKKWSSPFQWPLGQLVLPSIPNGYVYGLNPRSLLKIYLRKWRESILFLLDLTGVFYGGGPITLMVVKCTGFQPTKFEGNCRVPRALSCFLLVVQHIKHPQNAWQINYLSSG